MTGGYHIINAAGTIIQTQAGYSDYVIFEGTLKDIIDSIKSNKIIVLEGQKTTRGNNAELVDTGAWVLNFVHDSAAASNVDHYEAAVETGGARILFDLNWEEAEFGYSVEAL